MIYLLEDDNIHRGEADIQLSLKQYLLNIGQGKDWTLRELDYILKHSIIKAVNLLGNLRNFYHLQISRFF